MAMVKSTRDGICEVWRWLTKHGTGFVEYGDG